MNRKAKQTNSPKRAAGRLPAQTMQLFVVARPHRRDGTEIGSESAMWARDQKEAVAGYRGKVQLEYGDVPDAWYDTDCPIRLVKVGGLQVFGPYAVKP